MIFNHLVNPTTELALVAASDRAWCWSACDYSEELPCKAVFAARFANVADAAMYRKSFAAAREEMRGVTGQ
jgi:hypothetical protein